MRRAGRFSFWELLTSAKNWRDYLKGQVMSLTVHKWMWDDLKQVEEAIKKAEEILGRQLKRLPMMFATVCGTTLMEEKHLRHEDNVKIITQVINAA